MADRIVKAVFRGDVTGLVGPLRAASVAVRDTAGNLTAAGKEAERFRHGLTTVASTAGKVGLAAAVGVGVAVKAAADFNAEMALVRTLSHASASEMDKLAHAALTVGQNIGYTAKSVAQGEEELIKAGVSVSDILGGALKGSLDLAAAGQTDVATATEIAAAALTQFQMSGKDVPHLADLLAAGADKALGSVEDLGLGLTQVGTTAHQMGLSVEQTTGTLAAFAQAGLIGERGGTTFKQMLLQLAAPTSQAQKLMDKYGISLYDASGQMKTMPELADNLAKGLGTISPQARNAALGVIFGSRAIQGANILMADGAQGIQEWIDKVNDQGFAADQARGKLDSLTGDLSKFKAALQTAFIGSGEGTQGPLRDLVQGLTDVVNAYNKLPPAAQSTTTALLGITAVTGGGLWFTARTIKGVSELRVALDDLGPAATRARGALSLIGKGFVVGTALVGINALSDALDELLGHNLNESDLGRSLTSLSQGRVSGELTKYGKDLHGFSDEMHMATDAAQGFSRQVSKTPKIGDFLSAPPWTKSPKDARENIEKLDQALAGLVEAGQGDQAAAIFDRLTQAANEGGVSTAKVKSQFDQYAVAVKNAAGSTEEATAATSTYASTVDSTGNVVETTTEDMAALIKAMRDQRDAALSGFDAETRWRQALKDAAEQAKKSSAGIKGNSDEALKNRDALSRLADAWNNQSDATKNNISRFHQARQTFIDTATAMGVPREQARKLAKELLEIPDAKVVDVSLAGGDTALDKIRQIKDALNQIPPTLRTTYYVTQVNSINRPKAPSLDRGPSGADGMTVPGARYPYGDKTLILAAPGEELITNRHGEADQFRRDRAAGRIPAYADGGTVLATYSSTRGLAASDEELRAAGSLKHLREELERAKKAVEAERKVRDDLTQQREQLAGSVRSALTSELFAKRGAFSPQAGYVTGAISTLRSDIGRASAFNTYEQQLMTRGVKGDALRALEEQAQGDPGILAAFAAASQSDLSTFQTLFAQRAHETAAAGETAGASFNKAIAAETRELKGLRHDVRRLEAAINRSADRVGDKVNGSAAAGHRRKKARR